MGMRPNLVTIIVVIIILVVLFWLLWWFGSTAMNGDSAETCPVNTPTNLTAVTNGNQVILSWNTVTNATSYTLLIASSPNTPSKQCIAVQANVMPPQALTFVNGTYFFRVVAVRVCNGIVTSASCASNEVSVSVPSCSGPLTAPVTPQVQMAANGTV